MCILCFPFMLQIEDLCSNRFQIWRSYSTLETSVKNIAVCPTTGLLPIFIFHPEEVSAFVVFRDLDRKWGVIRTGRSPARTPHAVLISPQGFPASGHCPWVQRLGNAFVPFAVGKHTSCPIRRARVVGAVCAATEV